MMKRRLALLMTILITAAAVPSAQLMAAETGTEVMTEQAEEDTAPEKEVSVPENEADEADSREENDQSEEISAEQESEQAEDPAEEASEGLTEADGTASEEAEEFDTAEAAGSEEEADTDETEAAEDELAEDELTEEELQALEAAEIAIKVPTAEKALRVWAAGTLTLTGTLPAGANVKWSASPAGSVDLDAATGHYTLLKEGKVTFTATISKGKTSTKAAKKTASITVTAAGKWTLVDNVTRYYRIGAKSAEDFYKGWHETSADCWSYFDVQTGMQNAVNGKTLKGGFWEYNPVSKDSYSGKSATVSGSTVKVVGDLSGKTVTFKKGTHYADSKGMAVIKGIYPTSNKNGFYYLNDNFIYVNTGGVVASGWTMISGNIRYFDPKTHKIVYGDANGWKAGLPAGTVYDGDTNKAVKDPYSSGNMKIPADKETLLLTPKKKSDGSLNTGILTRNCWKTVNNCKFWFKDNGRRALGWWTVGKSTYYITKKTGCYKGLKQIDGKYYGFKDSGVMIKGWGKVKDKYYYFNTKTGVMAANTTVQGIKVDKSGLPSGGNNAVEMLLKAQNYGSGTKYLILVNRSAHKVAVYQGSKNNWKQIYYWACSVGKVIKGKSITPAGNFRVSGYKIYRFGAQSRSFYCTVLSSGNMIHSVQYAHGDSSPVHVVDGRLGYHITNSCIRLLVQNAKWVYNNCHEGTAVIVYNP